MANDPPTTKNFSCDPPCNRRFRTVAALEQHRLDAPIHANPREIVLIEPPASTPGAAIGSARGINAHTTSELYGAQGATIETLKATINSFVIANKDATKRVGGTLPKARTTQTTKNPRCILCNRPFATDQALACHIRDSPSHIIVPVNGVAIGGQKGKGKEEKSSPPARSKSRWRKTKKKAKKQGEAAPTAPPATLSTEPVATPVDTPLDVFFHSFGEFPYDRTKPPATSFGDLERHFGWERRMHARREAWASYQQALVDEVQLWYGDASDITAWHELCRAVGIVDPPSTPAACTKLMRRTHVNIVDLIEWGRNGRPEDHPVKIYKTIAKLRDYTLSSGRIFPKEDAIRESDGATNIVLRHLLRDFRRPGLEGRAGEVVMRQRRRFE